MKFSIIISFVSICILYFLINSLQSVSKDSSLCALHPGILFQEITEHEMQELVGKYAGEFERCIKQYDLPEKVYEVAQVREHHAEGTTLRYHIAMMLEVLQRAKHHSYKDIVPGSFLRKTLDENFDFLWESALLHDVGKVIGYPEHEKNSIQLLEGKISEGMKTMILLHGLEVFFREHDHDDNVLEGTYRKLFIELNGDLKRINLAVLVMYIDNAGALKIRKRGQTPFSEATRFLNGFLRGKQLFEDVIKSQANKVIKEQLFTNFIHNTASLAQSA